MTEIDDKFELGTWVKDEDMSAYTNVYMRRWRGKRDGKVVRGIAPFQVPGLTRDVEWYFPPPEPRETLKEAAMRLTTIPRVSRKKDVD